MTTILAIVDTFSINLQSITYYCITIMIIIIIIISAFAVSLETKDATV